MTASMSDAAKLLDQSSHFAFGKNWASYAQLVTEARVQAAIDSLRKLAGGDLEGKSFLDIGCGSGLHALAASRLGARDIVAIDIDGDSVATARQLLQTNAPGQCWCARQASVFDLEKNPPGVFDVVYSWGVLHHTGAMYRALRAAAALVAPGGQFIFALYRWTPLCWLWKIEKRCYAAATPTAQARARSAYVALFRVAFALRRRGSFSQYLADYRQRRGMDFHHDVHDWLGGWPYESISPAQTERFMASCGFQQVRAFTAAGINLGLVSSGCDEYVYTRK
jgi:2-polyprenyl-6-hydroxyphenyl methylase/3-demethylubiquinone-9 3-methyltransferase